MPLRFTISGQAYFAPNSTVVGDVEVGPDSSFWFASVVRGDVAPIRIGARVNVQDCAVIHCDTGVLNVIEDDVVIGHGAIVHGEHVGAGTLVGMGARLLGRTKIGRRCLIAAGAVVSPGTVVPDESVVMGVPGKVVRPVSDEERRMTEWLAAHYVHLARRYATTGLADVTKGETLSQ
jgi:carbonic anhydrase/acetyltransferase-like protein (isoleucine patch superfamily)